ncbi:DUF927 domain-containing protein [Azospirillum sp. RWY-5-1]|nr:DUF927 domain-containing protein [Azospirillum oleiclasticum]
MNAGYRLPQDRAVATLIHNHLLGSSPKEQRLVVASVGWHGDAFVLPNLPSRQGARVILFQGGQAGRVACFGKNGTLGDWKRHVAEPAAHSSRLVLSIALAFAAPLLRFTRFDSCGLHLEGPSSKGKTTCLLAATSVSGRPDRRELLTWDATKAALSETAMGHNDCLMCIDELANTEGNSAAVAQRMREVAYMLASGRGRLRSSVYGTSFNLKDARWRVLFLSTGEKAISTLAREANVDRLKGELVRLVDVPALASPGLGIYESLPDTVASPAAFGSDRVGVSTALRARVPGVPQQARREPRLSLPGKVEALVERFMTGARAPQDGWERRFARPFALSFAAGKLAIRWGIVPWKSTTVGRSMQACYIAARKLVPDAQELLEQGIQMLRSRLQRGEGVLDLLRQGTKTMWTAEQAKAAEIFACGTPTAGRHFLIKPAAFESWFPPAQRDVVLAWLERSGHLIKDERRGVRTLQAQIKGIEGRGRYYALKATLLQ